MAERSESAPLQFEVYRGLPGLEAIATEWRALAEHCARPAFSHYPEWYECYLRCLAPDPECVFFCLLRRAGMPVAVAPLELRVTHAAGIARRSLMLPQDVVNMPVADFTIAQTEDPGAVAQAILDGSARRPELRWDRVHLVRVPERSCCAEAVQSLQGYPCVHRAMGYGDHVALAPFDQMLGGLSRSTRKHLNLSRNRLARAGAVAFHTARDVSELAGAVEAFIEVESLGWKGRTGTAIKCSPKMCDFYRTVVARFGACGQCDIHALYVNNRPAAMELALRTDWQASLLKCGYDEAFAALSPGNALDAYVMQYYYERTPVRTVDLLTDFGYLRMWNPVRQPVAGVSVFGRNLSGVLAGHLTRGLYALQDVHEATTRRGLRSLQRRLKRVTAWPVAGRRSDPAPSTGCAYESTGS